MREKDTSAVIHVSREMQLPGFGVRAHVSVDGKHVGALWIGRTLTVPVEPGSRLLRVEGRGLGALTLESCWVKVRLAPGEAAAFSIFTRKGLMKSTFAVEPVPPPAPKRP